MAYSVTTPMTLVIDEFQEFDKIDPAIFGEIQGVWDRYHKKARLNLVVCGSVNRLMNKIFFDDSQPLYGRNTGTLRVDPFAVDLVKSILCEHSGRCINGDLLALWTLTGGVARYVELFMDARAWTRKAMLKCVCSLSSAYIDEGRVILSDEFGKEYGIYFSILSAIASGRTSFAEIRNIVGSEIGGHLTKLESSYSFISKVVPACEKSSNRNCLYRLDDCFFRFWFRFIYKYMHLIEQKQLPSLLQVVERDFDVFSGIAVEQ
jgi:AAA+ ATPase superfamily predicted ATPase